MTNNNDEAAQNNNSINLEILLDVTRQKLAIVTIQNTELEALVLELKAKINDLENKK